MKGTDAEAVRSEVTGEADKKPALLKAVPDPLMRLNSAKEPKPENRAGNNILLISLVFVLFFGAVCAALYFFGFFGSWLEESIDYGLITNLPDENLESFAYISAEEEAFKEASSMVGELLGGGLLKEIKKANIAYVQYNGGASGYAVYLESGQSIPGLTENLAEYLYPSLSYSQNKLGIEKKKALGIDYYLIKTPGGYPSSICAWKQGRGIVLLYYGGGYAESNKEDCNSLIGKKSSKNKFEELLKQPESIRNVLKTDDMPYAQGWYWTGSLDNPAAGYAMAYSDKDGIYLFAAGIGLMKENAQITGLCEGGSIIKSSGKEACFKDSTGSGISVLSLSTAISYERGAGEYTIYAFAYPKNNEKESVKKKAEKFIFSAGFTGTEKTWTDNKTFTINVMDEDTLKPIDGALTVYKNYGEKITAAFSDASGEASFKDMPIEFLRAEVKTEVYDLESAYVYQTDTNTTIFLNRKKTPLSVINKPKCGNALCESGENCESCPKDCICYKGECVNGACRAVPYSIELPSVKNRSWNITFTPLGEKIKVQSDKCFYLDVLYPSGEEMEPYDADVKNCVSASGAKYDTTGQGAAPWFNWGGCAGTKYFQVSPGTDLILRVYTESCPGCVCYYPQFDIYDEVSGEWVKYENASGMKELRIVTQKG